MLAAVVLGLVLAGPAAAEAGKTHRMVLQAVDGDFERLNGVLNVAANVSRYFSSKAEEIEIEIVAYDAGIALVRDDHSPVRERLINFMKAMPNVSVKACGVTLDTIARREGRTPPLIAGVEVVPAGVAELVELSEAGWTIVRP
jgi:hypothetical protein